MHLKDEEKEMLMKNSIYNSDTQEWIIVLNKYQRDNLLWLLILARHGYIPAVATGDWVGEIPFLLAKEGGADYLSPEDQPNVPLEEWIVANCPEQLARFKEYEEKILLYSSKIKK